VTDVRRFLVNATDQASDEGERLGAVAAESKDSILGAAQAQYRYPAGPDGETAVEAPQAFAQAVIDVARY
jgi:hypothetical protein